jgi:integrase
MTKKNSTTPAATGKPAKPDKPYPEFPLTAHPAGHWCKKIRGKIHYFGRWDDPEGALQKYLAEADALHAGRKPREQSDGTTVKELCNHFLSAKEDMVNADELSMRTWTGYEQACRFLVEHLGKSRLASDVDQDDFAAMRQKLSRRFGPHGLGTWIQMIRCCFKYAFDAGLIDRSPVYGPGFERPSKKTLRLHRAKQGPKLFTAAEIHKLLGVASVQLKAMILLGINCGFGNSDCGNLPMAALDLERGLIDYPRPKTAVPRKCCLWPETIEAIRQALAGRPEPKHEEHARLVFVTAKGLSWHKDTNDSPITKEMRKLLNALGVNGHRNFYTLRHTFRTVADESKDQPAVDFIMGHEVAHMSSHYREGISDERLKAVADCVHMWLFGEAAEAGRSNTQALERCPEEEE